MCGFVGFIERGRADATELAIEMAEQIRHRGPDDCGAWTDPSLGVTLAHRRLSIVDLSAAGHQPMHSDSGRYVIAFNGEIYNHLALRSQLEHLHSIAWRGHSDTETLLAGFEIWGIEATLKRSVGMFALAVVDKKNRTLSLARDRLGEKPLYYGWQGNAFLFGSELKALKPHPKWLGNIDKAALTSFMRLSYVPAPMCIFDGIKKLPPGCLTTLDLERTDRHESEVRAYWSLLESRSKLDLKNISLSDAGKELEARLQTAIAGQLQADVPVGAFLSGGVDSSLVVALMQAQCASPVRTFTIGFDDPRLNEATFAESVAKQLGTAHTSMYVSSGDVIKTIPNIIDIYDEPLADSSQIPTYLVSQLAVKDVKVSLSGDGGDELFAGYNRYNWGSSIWAKIRLMPAPMRNLVARIVLSMPAKNWDQVFQFFRSNTHGALIGDKLHKAAMMINVATRDGLYERLISQQREAESSVIGGYEPYSWDQRMVEKLNQKHSIGSFSEYAMLRDLLGYMSDDILAKLDRAAMAVSLETRAPLLDHRIVEFAADLPLHYKQNQGQTKILLRQLLYRYVPKELIERPKQGFSVPLDSWLKGQLKDWAYTHINPRKIEADGLLNAQLVEKRWQQHQSGEHNWQHWLWNVVMFQAWKDRWL